MSNTSSVEPEWVSVPEACRKDLLQLYFNEMGELANGEESIGETHIGMSSVKNEQNMVPEQDECKEEGESEECTYLELKTVPVEAYSQILYGGADGYSYVKTGQNCLESYRDEFGFYFSSLPDACGNPDGSMAEESAVECGSVEHASTFEGEHCSGPRTRLVDSCVESKEQTDNKSDSVSLMKLRLHRIISNSEQKIRQTTSNSDETVADLKVAMTRPVVRVDVPVRKMSCPMVSQIAATILDKWKSMRPLGVMGLGDLPKYTSTRMKAKVVSRSNSTSSLQCTSRERVDKKAVNKSQAKTSRAERALDRRRESQLALQQLKQMSKPKFKRRGRPAETYDT